MRRILIVVALALRLPALASGQTAGRRSSVRTRDERRITQMEAELIEARRLARSGDPNALERILSDDFTATSLTGRQLNKAQYVRLNRNPNLRFTSFKNDETRVRIYGSGAVVTGRVTLSSENDGGNPFRFRFTHIYAKEGARWLLVASHLTPIPRR